MDVRVQRSELMAELGPMQGVVERKTTIPVLSHLLLSARDGKLHLAATDLDVSLTSHCEADVKTESGIAVQARKLLEIVRSLASDEVHLLQEDPKILTILSGPSRFKLHGLAPEDFPSLPETKPVDTLKMPFAVFQRMIGKILFAVSAEESRFQLNGALLHSRDGALEMVATDGHRLALVESEIEGATESEGVLVPRKALQELQRFDAAGDLELGRGEHHLSFRIGRRELISRILEGTFPDHERAIAKDNDKEAVFEVGALQQTVQRVSLLTGDRARAVRLQLNSDQLVVSTANPDMGEAVEELECSYGGPEFRMGLNPDYLLQFLSVIGTEKVRFEIKDENSQCVGYPLDGDQKRYLCVIMPMRI